MEQISEKMRDSGVSEIPAELSYTHPPMDENEKERLRELAKSLPKYYANNVRIRTTVHDISLYFNRAVPVDTTSVDVEAGECVVSMSPAMMMSLHRLLERHVGIYKTKYGDLPDVLSFDDGPPKKDGSNAAE